MLQKKCGRTDRQTDRQSKYYRAPASSMYGLNDVLLDGGIPKKRMDGQHHFEFSCSFQKESKEI